MTCSAAENRRLRRPARRLVPALALLLPLSLLTLAGCASTDTPAGAAPLAAVQVERLLNPALSLELSQWLVGPAAAMASQEEEAAFLALRDDAAARAFIDDFWERRDPVPLRPDNPLRKTFEERSAEADRRYTEGGRAGSRTARGTIYVLYGEPSRTDYEIARDPRDPPVEVWFYEGDQPPGLDGDPPGPLYRFIKRDRVTEFYTPLRGIERARPVRPEDY